MTRAVFAILFVFVLSSCGPGSPPPPDFDPVWIPSSGAVIWQGLDHRWTYNHRWGRLGSGWVLADPEVDSQAYPVHEDPLTELPAPGWAYMGTAGAGTGIDFGAHSAWGARVESTGGVKFATVIGHHRFSGDEGTPVERTWTISAPAPDVKAAAMEAVLNGFWLEAVGDEAKQPRVFRLAVGAPRLEGDELAVDVTAALEVDCDTPECAGCTASTALKASDEFAYDLFVSVVVVHGPSSELTSTRVVGTRAGQEWDGPPELDGEDACLQERSKDDCVDYWIECGDLRLAEFEEMPADAGTRPVEADAVGQPSGFAGVVGFELELDRPHHMYALELGVRDEAWTADAASAETVVRFQNWAQGMNLAGTDADPRSTTAFGTAGSYTGRVDVSFVGLSSGTLSAVSVEETIMTEVTKQLVVPLQP